MDAKNQRQLRLRNNLVILGFVLAIILLCAFSGALIIDSLQGERREPTASLDGVEVRTLVELDGDEAYPESLTVASDGMVYSGSFCTGEIWRITPEGDLSVFVSEGIDAASGMAFSPDGNLYVVDHGSCDARQALSGLKRIAPDGAVSTFAEVEEDEILNDLTFDRDGILYATDTQQGEIVTYNAAGERAVWWEFPGDNPRPTGIAYDATRHAIVVADTNNGEIYRVTILEDGAAGEFEIVYSQDARELDGLTVDEQGRVIFTIFDSYQVAMIDENGLLTILAEGFREPSDVAYFDGQVYVTNFDSLSLAPLLELMIDPSLPFTIDVIDLRNLEG